MDGMTENHCGELGNTYRCTDKASCESCVSISWIFGTLRGKSGGSGSRPYSGEDGLIVRAA